MNEKFSDELILQFKDFKFGSGHNVTIRRGCKWSGVKGAVTLSDTHAPQRVKRGHISRTLVYKFDDLPHKFFQLMHAGAMTGQEVYKSMVKAYGGDFDELEIVTLIIFNVLGD